MGLPDCHCLRRKWLLSFAVVVAACTVIIWQSSAWRQKQQDHLLNGLKIRGVRYSIHEAPFEWIPDVFEPAVGVMGIHFLMYRDIEIVISSEEDAKTLRDLSKLLNLKSLALVLPKISEEDLDCIAKLSSLESLKLEAKNLTSLDKLSVLKDLKILNISYSPIDDVGMEAVFRFKKLERLILDGSNVTDKIVQRLGELSKLSHVELVGTNVSPDAIEKLKGAIPDVKVDYEPRQVQSQE